MSEKLLTPTQLFSLKAPTDLNTCLPGIYKITSPNTIKNTPTDGNGILISIKNSDSNLITQIFFGVAGGGNKPENTKIYWRNFIGIWGAWGSY